jgi:hypothetical protein
LIRCSLSVSSVSFYGRFLAVVLLKGGSPRHYDFLITIPVLKFLGESPILLHPTITLSEVESNAPLVSLQLFHRVYIRLPEINRGSSTAIPCKFRKMSLCWTSSSVTFTFIFVQSLFLRGYQTPYTFSSITSNHYVTYTYYCNIHCCPQCLGLFGLFWADCPRLRYIICTGGRGYNIPPSIIVACWVLSIPLHSTI